MSTLPWNRASFYTSQDRIDGMKLKILYENGVVFANIVLDRRFEDYDGHADQNIVFGILDEIIWYSILLKTKSLSMTRRVSVSFNEPLQCDKEYKAIGKVIKIEDTNIFVKAWVQDIFEKHYVELNGVFKYAKNISNEEFLKNFDRTECSREIKDFFLDLANDGIN